MSAEANLQACPGCGNDDRGAYTPGCSVCEPTPEQRANFEVDGLHSEVPDPRPVERRSEPLPKRKVQQSSFGEQPWYQMGENAGYRRPEQQFKPSRGTHPVTADAIDKQLDEHAADYKRLATDSTGYAGPDGSGERGGHGDNGESHSYDLAESAPDNHEAQEVDPREGCPWKCADDAAHCLCAKSTSQASETTSSRPTLGISDIVKVYDSVDAMFNDMDSPKNCLRSGERCDLCSDEGREACAKDISNAQITPDTRSQEAFDVQVQTDMSKTVDDVYALWLPRHPCNEKTQWHVENYISDLKHVLKGGEL